MYFLFLIALLSILALLLALYARRPLLVGDVHARPELIIAALKAAKGRKIILLGDLLDGPGGAQGSVECIRLARKHHMVLVLGNHELYPIFAKDQRQLATWWGEDPASDAGKRIWEEWMAIRRLLNDDDMEWLRSRPLFVKGSGWIAVHAKLTATLPAQYVTGAPTQAQIELVDHTESTPFWAEAYDGRFGHAYFGHTRLSKVKCAQWPHATLLDWDAKKGGTCGVCVLGGTPRALLG